MQIAQKNSKLWGNRKTINLTKITICLTALFCISMIKKKSESNNNIVAFCKDFSKARFELQRVGSSHYLSGSLLTEATDSQDFHSAKIVNTGIYYEFSKVELGLEDDALLRLPEQSAQPPTALVTFQNGAGALQPIGYYTDDKTQKPALPINKIEFLTASSNHSGRIAISTTKRIVELSDCQFNTTALRRIRGQEKSRYLAFQF